MFLPCLKVNKYNFDATQNFYKEDFSLLYKI